MLLFSVQSISAANITVHPGDSIQNAVNSASDGDNITVYSNNNSPYTYKESISINKRINIKASGNVTIEAKNTSSAVFTVNSNGAGSSIQNFLLTKTNYCIMINNANSCTLKNNTITGTSLVGIQFYGNAYNSKVIGNIITGTDPNVGNGISFEYGPSTNNTISGNIITNFLNGIIFNDNSENNTVSNNRVSCTGHHGVGIYTTDNARSFNIIGNTVTGAEDGIAVQQIGSNTPVNFYIDNNTLRDNKNGFWICLSNSTISNNTATQNLVSGMDITGKYNRIVYNNASNNGNCGITLSNNSNADYNLVDGNSLTYNKAGINTASNSGTISNNNASNNTNYGLIITANHVNVKGNTVKYNNDSGILVIGTYNTIDANILSNNTIGILIQKSTDSDYNNITNNILNYNSNGINSGSPYSNFVNNTITHCTENAMVNTADHVNVRTNTIQNNTGTGILSIGAYNVVANNVLSNNSMGIYLQKSTDHDYNSVTGNVLNNNTNGINSACPYSELNNNTVSNNRDNGLVNAANYVDIKGNTIQNNGGTGLLAVGCYINIINNWITGNNLGIYLQNSGKADYNTVTNNTANYNGNGINSGSDNTNFYNNTLNYNNQTGLIITGSNCYVVGNSMNFNKDSGLTVTGTNNIVFMNRLEQNLYGASFSNYKAAIFCFNSVIGNTYQLYSPDTTGTLNATNNWWGSNTSPSRIYGLFNVGPWIVMKVVGNPGKVNIGGVSNITADLTKNSNGENTTLIYPGVFVPDGITVNFSCDTSGVLSTLIGTTVNGMATTIFTGKNNGTSTILTTINSQSVSLVITILTSTLVTVSSSSGCKGDVVNLTSTLKDKNNLGVSGKSIKFYVDGNLAGTATTNSSGIASLAYTITQNAGIYTLMAQFLEDASYAAGSGTNNLVVLTNLIPTNITLNPVSGFKDDKFNLTATLKDSKGNPLSAKTVSYYVNGSFVGSAATNDYGIATFLYTITQNAGNYPILAQFAQDLNYASANSSSTLQVKLTPTTITVNPVSTFKGDNVNLTATLKDSKGNPLNNQIINYYINGIFLGSATTNSNAIASYLYTVTQNTGNYTITAMFTENSIYNAANNTNNIQVKLKPTSITVPSKIGYAGENIDLTAFLRDYNGLGVIGKPINFYINDVAVGSAMTDSNGMATLSISLMDQFNTNLSQSENDENYTIKAVFNEDSDYCTSNNTNYLTVKFLPTNLILESISGYKGNKINIIATLMDRNNNPITNKLIHFYLADTELGTATTDLNGIATLIYTLTQDIGTYPITAEFIGDGYSEGFDTNLLHVIPKKTVITVKQVSTFVGVKTNITATLTDANCTPLECKEVRFIINGSSIGNSITDVNGIVTLTYTFLKGGTYSLLAQFMEDDEFASTNCTKSLMVKLIPTKITVKPFTGYCGDKVNLTATITDTRTNTAVKGKTINFYVNGKLVGTGLTNSSGVAYYFYTINIAGGNYTLKAEYKQNTTHTGSCNSSILNVKKIPTKLTAIDVSGKKYARVKLTATLINTHSNTRLSNKTILFYISGKYLGKATTNKYGTATFYYTIKLKKGKYSIYTKYQSNSTYNLSTSTKLLKVT